MPTHHEFSECILAKAEFDKNVAVFDVRVFSAALQKFSSWKGNESVGPSCVQPKSEAKIAIVGLPFRVVEL